MEISSNVQSLTPKLAGLPGKPGYSVKGVYWVKNKGDSDSKHWEEPNTLRDGATIETVIAHFNETLRRGEKPRECIKIVSEEYVKVHRWDKTNLMGERDKVGIYDEWKCLDCDLKYKRRGLEWNAPMATDENPCKPKKSRGSK